MVYQKFVLKGEQILTEVLDIQEQVAFNGNNGPNLYYTFVCCLRGEAISEWWGHDAWERANDAAHTSDNFATDIDSFIIQHENILILLWQ